MKIEHIALNVADPRAMADWYVQHCGLRVVLRIDEPPFTRFLADTGQHVALEIYQNPKDPIPDYARQHHLRLHVAFLTDDPAAERRRLEAVGATCVEEVRLPGTYVITMRDPWGLAIQLCRREPPVL